MNHHLRQVSRVPLPSGARVVQGPVGGPDRDVLLVCAGDGPVPANLRRPRPGDARVVAALRLVSTRVRLSPHEMVRRHAMGRLTSIEEVVDRWEVWAPRGHLGLARASAATHERPDQALQVALRVPAVRAAIRRAVDGPDD